LADLRHVEETRPTFKVNNFVGDLMHDHGRRSIRSYRWQQTRGAARPA